MNNIPENDILQISINTYKVIGEYIKYKSRKLTLYRYFNSIVLIFNIICTLTNLSYLERGTYMKSLEGGATALHTLLKYLSFLYYKNEIEELFADYGKFWDYHQFNRKLCSNIGNIHAGAKNVQKFILIATACIMIIYCFRPVVNSEAKFIFDLWIPSGFIFLETITLASQYYMIMLVVPVIFAYDSVYFSFSVHMISQLRLLKYKLQNMAVVATNEVCKCIRHHQLVLQLFGRMKKIFFWMLLFHYFVTLVSGCSQLYTILTGSIKPMDLLSTTVYIIALFTQFAYYTFPAEEIVSELQSISTAIYMSQWLEMSLVQKKLLVFMMMRAQQQKYLSIGGIMEMNVNAFGSVIRKVFSFCTLLRNILSG